MTREGDVPDGDRIDRTLENELALLGRSFGGGGAGLGAWIAARLLRTRRYEARRVSEMSREQVLSAARSVVGILGRLSRADSGGIVVGVVGSGHGNMNPTVVLMTAEEGEAGRTNVVVRAAAKEGLVHQHSVERAVERILDKLVPRDSQGDPVA